MRNKKTKLKEVLEELDSEKSAAPDILKKIKQRQEEEDKKRAISEKFVEEFTKENGPIKYFRDQWFGTKVWREAYNEGMDHGKYESEEEHKEIIYKLVTGLYKARD